MVEGFSVWAEFVLHEVQAKWLARFLEEVRKFLHLQLRQTIPGTAISIDQQDHECSGACQSRTFSSNRHCVGRGCRLGCEEENGHVRNRPKRCLNERIDLGPV